MTSTGGPRGSYVRGRATRTQILDAALQVFAETGYHAASLREVAARVSISHPGLLHHFGSKAQLLTAVLDRRDEVDGERLAAERADGVDPLESWVRLAARNAAQPEVVALFTQLAAEATSCTHPAHAFFAARYQRVLDQSRRELTAMADAGRLRAGLDPAFAARLLVAAMDGFQLQWLLRADAPDRVDLADATARLRDLLVEPR